MGTMVSISIGNYNFLSYKNTFGDLLMPYSSSDLICEDVEDDEGRKYTRRYFKSTVKKFIRILDSSGHTMLAARDDFERNKAEELEYIQYCIDEGEKPSPSYEEFDRSFTFDEWCKVAGNCAVLLSKDTFDWKCCKYAQFENARPQKGTIVEEKVMRTLPFGEGFFGMDYEHTDCWNVFRVLLNAFPEDEEIILDYTDLYESGWCNEVPNTEDYNVPKTIILTEGKFDVEVISNAINILYPHMSKYYSFINFDDYKVQGSTNFLTHYLKAFIASGIQNRVIALYDNDSAGLAELEVLKTIRCPDNFRIMRLPDIAIAENYPTLGPNGMEQMNINGKACSIEMYLGNDTLRDGDGYTPIQWKGFVEKTQTYQGEIMRKQAIQERFREKVKQTKESKIVDTNVWKELDFLLRCLFDAFVEI